jgi:hypothetical protein
LCTACAHDQCRRTQGGRLFLFGVSLDQAVQELAAFHHGLFRDVFVEAMDVAGVIAAEERGEADGRDAGGDQLGWFCASPAAPFARKAASP